MNESNGCESGVREGSSGNTFSGYLPDAVYCAYYRGLLEAVAERYRDDIQMLGICQQQLTCGGHLAGCDAAANLNKTNGCEAASPPLEAEKEQLRSPLCSGEEIAGEPSEGSEPIPFRPHSDIMSLRTPSAKTPCHPRPRVILQRPQRRGQAPSHLNPTSRQEQQQYAKRQRMSIPVKELPAKDDHWSMVANANVATNDEHKERSASAGGKGFDAGNLLPELLESIFRYLDVQARGRAAQVRNV